MNTVKIKINPSDFSFEEVKNDEEIRLIAFEYLIPRPVFPPVKRISKLYCVKGDLRPSALKYNLPNFIFCWIGLPFGPVSAYAAFLKNKQGIDFTIDAKFNLKKEDFDNGFVTIEKLEEIFVHPDKSTLKELSKVLKKFAHTNGAFEMNPIVGLNIESETPSYFIGIAEADFGKSNQILELIYKYFYKHTKFTIVSLDERSELLDKLKKQGEEITLC